MRLVDLDDAAGLQRAVDELDRIHRIRQVDPELRANILRHLAWLSDEVAAPIREVLDQLHPAAVLDAHFTTLVPNRPTVCAHQSRASAARLSPPSRPRPLDAYKRVLRDMVEAGLPYQSAVDAVRQVAREDGTEIEEVG